MGSYHPNKNKVKCPLRSIGDTRIFVRHSHKENGHAHVWHSHKNTGDTQDICDIHTKKCGRAALRKRGKNVWQSPQNKINVWNKRKQGGL